MPDRRTLAGLLAAAVLAGSLAPALAAEDGPGPNLVIEVGGETDGRIVIDLLADVAPQHVERIVSLAESGAYDDVVFHRVIGGFMAQTGDVQFGKAGGDTSRAGMGGSEMPDLPAEFSNVRFERGAVGMARSQSPDSANSQFFIMFDAAPYLDGQYTVVGQVIEGMDVVDAIKKGNAAANGAVDGPDRMTKVTVER
ncbi:peptidylprolyl isomerase [Tropicimonas isoalkanivorans]|uniref:Peptidyl-prolyl cis-trans isomerase n=1 Tax=Tropicimonas isoalkanivorans TaxID=441112 RepID=A0A1I1E8N8_9RHOB|nr:peptidylprolyl isomerase [Tropicimonas isoalkanivorans]SFB82992.1 peptidylprolyl isomerase [Tropicimonas isoalkanivorans]